jgi:alpha-ketoglutarate-dependent taurine dioxygenase
MITTHLLSPNFGAELDHKLTLVSLSDTDVEALKLAIAQAGVLVARDQEMTADAQAQFAARLGELFPSAKPSQTTPEGLIRIKAD